MRLNIQSIGLIAGGTFDYNYDREGNIAGDLNLQYHPIFGTATLQKSFAEKVDPALLLSGNVKVGETLNYSGVSITITNIVGLMAYANVSINSNGFMISGVTVLDLSAPQIKIASVHANGSFALFNFTVSAIEAAA